MTRSTDSKRTDLDIAPGTQPCDVVRLRARGVPQLHGKDRGDLMVHVEVEVPTKLDEEQEQLLRQLANLRGEEQPEARIAAGVQQGIFARLRDAISGH